jgi:predicted PurR-regulated permease PerM
MRTAQPIELRIRLPTLILISAVVLAFAAAIAISAALLLVATAIFLALVFERPVRYLQARTGWGRGIASAIVVLGSAALVTVLALLLLVPLVTSVIDFLKDLPQLVSDLRASDELSWAGDSGAAGNIQEGSEKLAASIPDAVASFLGLAGQAFSVGIAIFSLIFLCLFLLIDVPRLRGALSSVLMPESSARWLRVWDAVTDSVSHWAFGAITIAIIAGTVQGGTAALLGSSYALALGVIAGLLDLIPTVGATIAGCILVPTLLAEEGLTAALIMLAVILVYQQVENNLLSPTIYGKAVDVSGFFIMLSVTLLGSLLGVLGALVAVPVTAAVQIVLREITTERRARIAAVTAAAEPDAGSDLPPATQPAG